MRITGQRKPQRGRRSIRRSRPVSGAGSGRWTGLKTLGRNGVGCVRVGVVAVAVTVLRLRRVLVVEQTIVCNQARTVQMVSRVDPATCDGCAQRGSSLSDCTCRFAGSGMAPTSDCSRWAIPYENCPEQKNAIHRILMKYDQVSTTCRMYEIVSNGRPPLRYRPGGRLVLACETRSLQAGPNGSGRLARYDDPNPNRGGPTLDRVFVITTREP